MLTFPPNFAQVVPGLYRSGSPGIYLSRAQRGELVQALDLLTVVRLSGEEPDASWPAGVRVTSLPGVKPVMTRAMFKRWKKELKRGLPLLVHCHMGAERTGVYVAHAEVMFGLPMDQIMSRLRKHSEGYWRRPSDRKALGHLRRSLLCLRETGDVLSDEEIASFLDLDPEVLDEDLNEAARWEPR